MSTSTPSRRSVRDSTQSATRATELARQQDNQTPLRRQSSAASSSRSSSSASSASGKKKSGASSSSGKKSDSTKKNGRTPSRNVSSAADEEEADEDLNPASAASVSSRSSREQQRHSATFSSDSFSSSSTSSSQQHERTASTSGRTVVGRPRKSSQDNSNSPSASLTQLLHDADLGKRQLGNHNDQYIEDISVEFLYKPHTVTALIILVGLLVFLAFRLETSTDLVQNLRYGAGAAAGFVLILGLVIFPAGPFIRPHPLMWRFAFGLGVLYEIWLIVVAFQTKEQARAFMKFFDSSLGVPIEERSYAADCSFNLKTIIGAADMFVISHFVGWIIKALILRDPVMCWVISIQWELIEILFMHMLPNFAEVSFEETCWWDQWILDVALANGLGIYLGCKLAKYLEVKQYNWYRYETIPSYLGKAKRTIMQFTPASWTKIQWQSTSSISRLLGVQLLIFIMHLEELNAFFLKYLLWMPPECKLNLIRLMIFAFVGVPSIRQMYSYMVDPHCKRIGHQTFLGACILATECIVIVKFGRGEFPNPMPDNVRIGFAIYLVGYFLVLLFLALRIRTEKNQRDGSEEREETKKLA